MLRLEASVIGAQTKWRRGERLHREFRPVSSRFEPDQVWIISRPRRWRFVDETADVIANSWWEDEATIDSGDDAAPIEPSRPAASSPSLPVAAAAAASPLRPHIRHLVSDPERQAAILLRYYVDELAARFDLCDPQSHFARVVPHRARSSTPLRMAILTTSARHLVRLPRHRNSSGEVEWQGHRLPELTEESALDYHTTCIRDLLALSMDPEQVHNENLLAAAIILRTDEEMDAPLREEAEDQEVFLRMLNVFISAQVHCVESRWSSPADGLRQAAFWVALRQEVLSSFMKQRAVDFPLAHCQDVRSLSPAPDAVWANRMVIFCADVLECCYGRRDASAQRWQALVTYQEELHASRPPSFDALYCRDADPRADQIFPEIWHLDRCHVTGTNHGDLARLLLLVCDPTRPPLGPGSAARRRETMQSVRVIVRRLCGVALSNRHSPSTFFEALMGIITCGEYFDDAREQTALLDVLGVMRREHAFPTESVEARLRTAWLLQTPG
ncbi:uncharacterized protein LDX57_006977 [Aspergillus melleus]|uniref:uncharacterized protein n=1 Tax=Aspergillus melleus TaxID=138277 RepID=UPI001E8DFF44|nr:uncharacterized protein LDX57_006977 [Aspergillus melleus]KAH8429310.1 hypothetical protein LDX57_006977 [Aspergillus melleus]